jgi:AcrR family transcriptional regulator
VQPTPAAPPPATPVARSRASSGRAPRASREKGLEKGEKARTTPAGLPLGAVTAQGKLRWNFVKGIDTKAAVLAHATRLARTVGLEGLSIGALALELGMSKSGLFAHFKSKENLQVEVIEDARRDFVGGVIGPAFTAKRGEPRVKALFDSWLSWAEQTGGCLFVSVASELDDREGPAREAAVKAQRDWLDTLAHAAKIAVDEGHFQAGLDTVQFAFEEESIMLGCHFSMRFLRDPKAKARATKAFQGLLERSRAR